MIRENENGLFGTVGSLDELDPLEWDAEAFEEYRAEITARNTEGQTIVRMFSICGRYRVLTSIPPKGEEYFDAFEAALVAFKTAAVNAADFVCHRNN